MNNIKISLMYNRSYVFNNAKVSGKWNSQTIRTKIY